MIYSIGNKRCQLFSQFSLGPKALWDCWSGPTGQSSCVLLTGQSPARHGWDRSREIPGCCRELGAPRPHVLLLQHPPAQRGGRADGRAAQKSSHRLQANATPVLGREKHHRDGGVAGVGPSRLTSHRLMDARTATAATSRASLPFAPQLSRKGAGEGLANTGFLSPCYSHA